jgi:hypothetical protein
MPPVHYLSKPIAVDWDHRLTENLVCALPIGQGSWGGPGAVQNLVTGELFTGTSRIDGFASPIVSAWHRPWMDFDSDDFTIMFWKSGGGTLADWEGILNIGGQPGITVQKNGSNSHMRVYINSNYQNITSFGTSEIEAAQQIVFRKDSLANLYMFIDGVEDSNAAHNNSPSASGASASIGYTDAIDTMYQVLIWDFLFGIV